MGTTTGLALTPPPTGYKSHLAYAEQIVTAFAEGTPPQLAFVGPDGEVVAAEAQYKSGHDPYMTGGAQVMGLRLSATRPGNGEKNAENLSLPSRDIDPLVRRLVPRFQTAAGRSPTDKFEGNTVFNPFMTNFGYDAFVIVPSAASFSGQAQVNVSFTRAGMFPGAGIQDQVDLVVDMIVDGMRNDQPVSRRGFKYVDNDGYETVEQNDVFLSAGYYFPERLGREAIAQVVARMLAAGMITVVK